MLRHVFFDLDKTLTRARAPMAPEHVPLFKQLTQKKDVIVVTGGRDEQIFTQIPFPPVDHYYMLSQQGNHAVGKDGSLFWQEYISEEQENRIGRFIEHLKKELDVAVKDENDLVENRGSQIAYSVIGFHEDLEKKYAYDPDSSKRLAALLRLTAERAQLHDDGIDVMPAGTTTYDFILAGKNKGYNIQRLIQRTGWNTSECIYVGDALFPGGNDESVIGIIPTHPVTDPDDTFTYIESILAE